jgi:hypothetical protein
MRRREGEEGRRNREGKLSTGSKEADEIEK